MLGEMVSILLGENKIPHGSTHRLLQLDESEVKDLNDVNVLIKRPIVALVVPATSKGISAENIMTMSFLKAFIPSLYATRSKYGLRINICIHAPIIVYRLFD